MVILKYNDDFGNVATIEEVFMRPYKDAKRKEKAYRLKLMAKYEHNFCYFISVYDTLEKAMERLRKTSCNSWKEVQ